ncbi:MAG: His/Gly/Thr/Pro-type tRNA ligase C-terminal domain-containing protein, partial [Chitinispirillaceae bacterium]|nr:His/Gly/Thr/Pro-type tRNA ligase C-terminal domain-containing protein [Chitinispirillaceae bacterium]
WLSPVQVVILPVSEKFTEYANAVSRKMSENRIRVEIDMRNEKIGYKIRDAEVKKIPFICVVGEKEQAGNSISVRKHGKIDLGQKPISEFISFLISENQTK